MQIKQNIVRITGIAFTLFLLTATTVTADDSVIGPQIPKAKANAGKDKCVLPVAEMRRNHMQHILHQRDNTVHDGIRSKQFSLVECINCHVSPTSSGEKIRVSSPKHFCNSCHTYSAVTIDCFECHNDQPTGSPHSASTRNDDNLQNYAQNAVVITRAIDNKGTMQ